MPAYVPAAGTAAQERARFEIREEASTTSDDGATEVPAWRCTGQLRMSPRSASGVRLLLRARRRGQAAALGGGDHAPHQRMAAGMREIACGTLEAATDGSRVCAAT